MATPTQGVMLRSRVKNSCGIVYKGLFIFFQHTVGRGKINTGLQCHVSPKTAPTQLITVPGTRNHHTRDERSGRWLGHVLLVFPTGG